MRILVTNLKGTDNRKGYMRKQMDSLCLEFEFVDCIDGRGWSDEEVKQRTTEGLYDMHVRHKSWLTKGALAASLTHVNKIYKSIIDKKNDYTLCLEDDVILPKGFKKKLEVLYLKLKKEKIDGVILLHYNSDRTIVLKEFEKAEFGYNLSLFELEQQVGISSGAGYIVSYNTAKKLYLSQQPLVRIADWWDGHLNAKVIPKIYIVYPRVINVGMFESTLGYVDQSLLSKVSILIKKSWLGSIIIRQIRMKKCNDNLKVKMISHSDRD